MIEMECSEIVIGTPLPASSASPKSIFNQFIRAKALSHRPSIGDPVWFSWVGMVLFVGVADQVYKKIELLLSCTSGDRRLPVITIRKPGLIKSDLCANGVG